MSSVTEIVRQSINKFDHTIIILQSARSSLNFSYNIDTMIIGEDSCVVESNFTGCFLESHLKQNSLGHINLS